MKTLLRSTGNENGSVLATSLMVSALLGVTLGSYLLIARSAYVGASYSHSWHQSLTMAEAGVEEALAQMNGAGVASGASSAVSSNAFHREFGGGAYDVQITPGPGASAIIYSTGYVAIAKLTNVITRVLVVKTTNAPMFTGSVAAMTNISMATKGKGITFSDSFDSANPKALPSAHGVVACLTGTLSIGSSSVLGDLLLGPTATAGSVHASGTIFHNFNSDFPDVVVPPATWLPAAFAHQTIDATEYTYVFNNKYTPGEFTIQTDGSIYVAPDANVSLQILSPNFNAANIYVAGTNQHAGRLVIYALQPSVTFGNVTVESGKPASLLYLGTSQNTSLTLNNDPNFVGSIYAPSAVFTYNVGSNGKKTGSFSGSCMAKSVQVNGPASFHFDEDLVRNSPVSRGHVITSWKEL